MKRDTFHERLVRATVEAVNEVPGVKVWRNDTGMMPVVVANRFTGKYRPYGTPFVSDILGYMSPHGRFVAIEIKTGRGKASEGQAAFLEYTRDAGGVSVLCHWDYAKHPRALRSTATAVAKQINSLMSTPNEEGDTQ